MASRSSWVQIDRSVSLSSYSRSSLSGFSQVPLNPGLWKSQKYTRTPVSAARSAWRYIFLQRSNVKV